MKPVHEYIPKSEVVTLTRGDFEALLLRAQYDGARHAAHFIGRSLFQPTASEPVKGDHLAYTWLVGMGIKEDERG